MKNICSQITENVNLKLIVFVFYDIFFHIDNNKKERD